MKNTKKLTAAQQRVLDAAARDELTYHQSSGAMYARYEIDNRRVSDATMYVLMHERKLLVGPTMAQKMGRPLEMVVRPNEDGLALVTKEEK